MTQPLLEVRADDSLKAVETLKGLPEVVEVALFGRALHVTVTDAGAGRRAIVSALSNQSRTVEDIRDIVPSLEDVFIGLVQAAGGAPVD